jgi:hypothetical protein
MAVSRRKATSYAERLLDRPVRDVPVVLRHGKGGVTLLHKGKAITRCHATAPGKLAAELVAMALGVPLPPIGESVKTSVSTGVLFRAVSIAGIDPRMPEAQPLLERLIHEAADQLRAGGAEQ